MNDKPKTLTPKLRFPEFRDGPGFSVKTVGQLEAQIAAGGTPDTSEKRYWNGELRWMNSGELNLKRVYEVEGRITEEGLRNSSTQVIPERCVLIGLAGQGRTRGTVAMNMVPLCTNQSIAAIFPNEGTFDSDFLYHNLDSRYEELRNLSAGDGGRGGLNLQLIRSVAIPLPSPCEQKKIAACLTSLDEWIAAEGRKLEALRIHKKGLMQELFPSERETRPQLRFPEFRNAPEWTAHPLDEFVVRSFYGTSSSTSEKGQYPVLRMGNMVDGGLDISNLAYINLDREEFESIRLMDGDILLNRTNSMDLVGKISIFRLPGNYITASYIVTYRMDADRLDPTFCNVMLNTSLYQKRIKALARPSVSQANINPTTFRKELTIAVPTMAEQQRIAVCLSSLDTLIAAQWRKLGSLRAHKKGLIQQLFPSPEEV